MSGDREFGDAVYEVWRAGGNPDHVSRDDADYYQSRGYDEQEAWEMVVEDCAPEPARAARELGEGS